VTARKAPTERRHLDAAARWAAAGAFLFAFSWLPDAVITSWSFLLRGAAQWSFVAFSCAAAASAGLVLGALAGFPASFLASTNGPAARPALWAWLAALVVSFALLFPQALLFDHYRATGITPFVVGVQKDHRLLAAAAAFLPAALLAALAVPSSGWLTRGRARFLVMAALLAAASGVAFHRVTESDDVRRVVFNRSTLTGRIMGSIDRFWDRDGDTFAPQWLGGGDADDGDPAVHPLAEWSKEAPESGDEAAQWEEGGRKAPDPTNILLITDDTLRADHLGCYGYPLPTSPVIDSLASRGILFERCLVPLPKTSPSLASLLTGKPPAGHGVRLIGQKLDKRHLTTAEILAAFGYATYGITRNGVVSAAFGFDQGFRRFAHLKGKNEPAATDTALAWLEDHVRGPAPGEPPSPFFLWIHYLDPHGPYDTPRPYSGATAEETEEAVLGGRYGATVSRWLVPPYQWQGTDRVARYIHMYNGEVSSVDREVGRLLRWLDGRGLRGSTLVDFTSDHGESFTEHDFYFEHGDVPYDDNARVPLIMSYPGVFPEGARFAEQVSNIDVLPTILGLLGIPPLPGPEGWTLLPAILGEEALHPRPLHILANYVGPYSPRYFTNAVTDGDWKVVYTPEFHILELYDLRSDPWERENVWGRWGGGPDGDARREAGERLRSLLAKTMIADRAGRRPEAPRETDLGKDVMEQLRSLGYVN
jgi:arylsulfatase A-like enzyme